jgi:hypothetical protein
VTPDEWAWRAFVIAAALVLLGWIGSMLLQEAVR